MRRKKGGTGSCANWLDTYADMVTLMLTFFVLLFAMSTMSASKWQKMVQAFQRVNGTVPAATASGTGKGAAAAFTAPSAVSSQASSSSKGPVSKVKDFDDLYPYFQQYVQSNKLQNQVELFKGDGYTFISFQNSIFFDGDSAALRPQATKILDFICDAMAGIPNQIGEIRFYGHTAKVTNTDTVQLQASDRDLSDDRAKNVLIYVQSKGIIGGEKMVSEGYGEYRPLVKDDGTEATRAKNRRVEIYISKAGKTQDVLAEVYAQINKEKAQQKNASSGGNSK